MAAINRYKQAYQALMKGDIPDLGYLETSIPTYEELNIWDVLLEFVKPHPNYVQAKRILKELKEIKEVY